MVIFKLRYTFQVHYLYISNICKGNPSKCLVDFVDESVNSHEMQQQATDKRLEKQHAHETTVDNDFICATS